MRMRKTPPRFQKNGEKYKCIDNFDDQNMITYLIRINIDKYKLNSKFSSQLLRKYASR